MKIKAIALCFALTSALFADNDYYTIVEGVNGRTVQQSGKIAPTERYSPCSTFKIPLALIGYECNYLKDENDPVLPYKKEYPAPIESWKQDQTPKTWIANSCVWYSQQMTKKIGMQKIKKYLADFNYGNQDMSGDPGQNNGITNAWLNSSLKISPFEQVIFIKKLINDKLPVSPKSIEMTKKLLYIETLDKDWKFFGKTGSGSRATKTGEYYPNLDAGWFIGWVEKGDSSYIIAVYIEDDKKLGTSPGIRAKQKAKTLLLESGILK